MSPRLRGNGPDPSCPRPARRRAVIGRGSWFEAVQAVNPCLPAGNTPGDRGCSHGNGTNQYVSDIKTRFRNIMGVGNVNHITR
ncbi:hypothetical protein ACFOLD_07790 [Kocuria carniphila]|uniref:hypothetical protein n=1 Tax=Kocuria carniphila TaxID=262208 RepID=UPI003620AA67